MRTDSRCFFVFLLICFLLPEIGIGRGYRLTKIVSNQSLLMNFAVPPEIAGSSILVNGRIPGGKYGIYKTDLSADNPSRFKTFTKIVDEDKEVNSVQILNEINSVTMRMNNNGQVYFSIYGGWQTTLYDEQFNELAQGPSSNLPDLNASSFEISNGQIAVFGSMQNEDHSGSYSGIFKKPLNSTRFGYDHIFYAPLRLPGENVVDVSGLSMDSSGNILYYAGTFVGPDATRGLYTQPNQGGAIVMSGQIPWRDYGMGYCPGY